MVVKERLRKMRWWQERMKHLHRPHPLQVGVAMGGAGGGAEEGHGAALHKIASNVLSLVESSLQPKGSSNPRPMTIAVAMQHQQERAEVRSPPPLSCITLHLHPSS